MSKNVVLVTGAGGEMGHGLISYLLNETDYEIVAIDLNDCSKECSNPRVKFFQDSIVNPNLLLQLESQFSFTKIFHLAALLSTASERDPIKAFEINVTGSLLLLKLAQAHSSSSGNRVTFLFPSSIAAHGFNSVAEKRGAGAVTEEQFLNPTTMYGINKISVEQLGNYLEYHCETLEPDKNKRVDFRAIRFPGILSAETLPTGGTSDYGPEMLHAAAQGKDYSCFVTPAATIPFITMPDAIRGLFGLATAEKSRLTKQVYNIAAFSVSAKEIHQEIQKYYPNFNVNYQPDARRLAIVESWPMDLNDSAAQKDWDWKANYDFSKAFSHYLVPAVDRRYNSGLGKFDNCVNSL